MFQMLQVIGLMLVIVFGCFVIAYLFESDYRKALWQYIRSHNLGFLILGFGVISQFLDLYYSEEHVPFFLEIFRQWGPELVGIAITVLVIDFWNSRRQKEQLKAQLIREMGGPDVGFTLRAARELAHHGWLYDGSLDGAFLAGANLAGGFVLSSANLQKKVSMKRANLMSAEMTGSDLQRINLEGANLRNANLQATTLIGANLTEAYLVGTHMEEADLRGANLEGANLLGATYDKNTVWPNGFDPARAGAKLVE